MRHEEPVAGARLEDDIVSLDVGEENRDRGEIDGRRELLPFDLVLAANGLGRQPVKEIAGGSDIIERVEGIGAELEMVRERVFEDLEAITLGPEAIGVRSPETLDHCRVEIRAGDRVGRTQAIGKNDGRAAFSRGGGIEEIGHGGVSGLAAPSAASILRPPSPSHCAVLAMFWGRGLGSGTAIV
ncbi:hypothetical protein NSU_4571 [Novosphingobium pentaromativorans US6-1]|uniref:Uncharacterized protein n=1 Tax=Novosphingobium pentaromativorans US6-1 TaxID=1088721 RepID=G6EJQ0_9SPHN|nr:hypothetical protein NSU_4571 [Novosphingobium pentaromativorans US6-1]